MIQVLMVQAAASCLRPPEEAVAQRCNYRRRRLRGAGRVSPRFSGGGVLVFAGPGGTCSLTSGDCPPSGELGFSSPYRAGIPEGFTPKPLSRSIACSLGYCRVPPVDGVLPRLGLSLPVP